MSDPCTSYEKWLSKLRDHLAEECYAARTSQRCVVVARHFLDFLAKQHIEVDAATPAHVEHYLQRAERGYRRRHGHSPDYRGWRPVQTSSVHMLLRLVHGQWPPLSVAVTPADVLREKICGEYARWMSDLPALRAEDVAKVLAVTERDRTRKGIRDYAILMLLSRYGMRAGEITALRLQDIDWHQEVIRIHQSKTDYPS